MNTPEGNATRPTTDQTREALFSMIGFDIAGAGFLDLFSGSGAVGIEALSRGAACAVFVEKDRGAAGIIRSNISACGFQDKAQIKNCDVMRALEELDVTGQSFDFIFMDPPYAEGETKVSNHIYTDVLEKLANSCVVGQKCIIIVEHSFPVPEQIGRLKAYRTKRYGVSHLTFFREETD